MTNGPERAVSDGGRWTAAAPWALALLLPLAGAYAQDAEIPSPDDVVVAIGHLGPVPVPDDNPLTREKAELGRMLFEDTDLAGDGSLSCQSCHLPEHGFAVDQALGPAYPNQTERRNSPTLVNVAFNLPLIWDGRAGSLDAQTLGPIQNILHQNNDLDMLIEKLRIDADYQAAFEAAYGDPQPTPERIAKALGSYERTLVFDDSPLDRYMEGDEEALDASQKRGLALFLGKANCVACHGGPNLTDHEFHALGVPDDLVTGDPAVLASIRFDAKRMEMPGWEDLTDDPGRALVTHDPADHGAFRTMGLRNVAQSPPYMHNGALTTLEEVVDFYDRGGGEAENRDPLLEPLGLSDAEKQELVSFLHALTGRQRPFPE